MYKLLQIAVKSSVKIREICKNKSRKGWVREYPYFDVGDFVSVLHVNYLNRNELDATRTGPFQILGKFSNFIYNIGSGINKTK